MGRVFHAIRSASRPFGQGVQADASMMGCGTDAFACCMDVFAAPRHCELCMTGRRDEQEERRFRLLVESVTDYAIFILDLQGRVTTWNAGAERIKGYAASEIIGQHFSKFYPREDVEGGKGGRELEEASSAGRFEEEGWRLRKGG